MKSECDRCGEAVESIDAGFSPGLHEMRHACGGTWREVPETRARAAAHISASLLAGGTYAHFDDAMSRYYVVTADELDELCDYLDDADPAISGDAYSHWCAGTAAKEMPVGWAPGAGSDEAEEP